VKNVKKYSRRKKLNTKITKNLGIRAKCTQEVKGLGDASLIVKSSTPPREGKCEMVLMVDLSCPAPRKAYCIQCLSPLSKRRAVKVLLKLGKYELVRREKKMVMYCKRCG